MAYTKAGLSPDGSSSYYLPRLIGIRRTQQLMLTNRTLSAAEALDWGLLTEVVPDAELPARAAALAQDMAATSRTSNSTVKKLLLDTYRTGLEEQMELEGRYIKDSAQSADGQEGIAAFVAKRAPVFG
jgi:2-(1,2-epoxy-1,2-dihydrophenyl)acetyl-CoA isomerase